MKPISVFRALFAVAIPAAAWAQASLPTGANVVAGSATISATANSMTVTTGGPRTIIDYSGFSVGAGNSVRFNQPSTSSATLNRVISTEGSSILGSVSSNGQIFLVNPNGIFVGPGGSFSGSSVYLSTGNISNADFLAGNIRFDPPPTGKIIRVDGSIDATDMIRFNSENLSVTGMGNIHGASIILDPENIVVQPSPPTPIVDFPATPPITQNQGGTIVVSGTGTSGNLVLTGGTSTPPDANITIIPPIKSGPINPVVISGSATLTPTGKLLTVANSNGAIVNWNKFSIAAGEVTRFAQPSASTAVFNRVTGDPVQIYGTLSSNGKVWLVDPAGNIVSSARVVSTDGLKPASASIQTLNVVAAPAPLPRPAARPAAPSIPSGTSGLVDGTVTVRLSLVDAAPISLR